MSSNKQKQRKVEPNELSAADKELKEALDLIVLRIQDNEQGIQKNALDQLRNEIKGTTMTMTAIPKHLKFLRPHYPKLCAHFETMSDGDNKRLLADILSLLAMTVSAQFDAKKKEGSEATEMDEEKEQNKEKDSGMEIEKETKDIEKETQEKEEEEKKTDAEKDEKGKKKDAEDEKAIREAKEKAEELAQIEADQQMKIALEFSLKYKLQGNLEDLETWGHEYIRNLSGQVAEEYNMICDEIELGKEQKADSAEEDDTKMLTEEEIAERIKKRDEKKEKLLVLIKLIVPFQIAHNAETDACDLLLETHLLELLVPNLDLTSRDRVSVSKYRKVCTYLNACCPHFPHPEDYEIYRTIHQIFMGAQSYCNALRYALKLNDANLVVECFLKAPTPLVRKQLAFILSRNKPSDLLNMDLSNINDEERNELQLIASNSKLSKLFIATTSSLSLSEPKDPHNVFFDNANSDQTFTANERLGLSIGTAFMNAGYGTDTYISSKGTASMLSKDPRSSFTASAGVGLLHLWDVDDLSAIEKYTSAESEGVNAGALLALGIASANVRNECDPVFALLNEELENKKSQSLLKKIGCVLGLGLAYAGTARDDICEVLTPFLGESDPELVGVCALSLGLVQLGSAHGELTEILITLLMESDERITKSTFARFICLGLGLLFLGRDDQCELAVSLTETFPGEIARYARVTVESCAYACSGDVLRFQQLLSVCGEHPPKEEKKEETEKESDKTDSQPKTPQTTPAKQTQTQQTAPKAPKKENGKENTDPKEKTQKLIDPQSAATLGLGLVVADEVAIQMTTRMSDHLLRYGEPSVRKTVPLMLALMYISNPTVKIIDLLTKLTHDHDRLVSLSSILALGICSAGTGNSRAGNTLKDLTDLCAEKPDALLVIRIAQSFLHLGKGALTLSPHHSDGLLLSPVAIAGVLIVLHAALDFDNLLIGKCSYLLYALSIAIFPRVMQTIAADEETIKHAKELELKEKEEREKSFRNRKTVLAKQNEMQVESSTTSSNSFVDDLILHPLRVHVRVGQRVDTAGLAGRPAQLTGIQTHRTPVLLSHNDRAECAADDYVPISDILEGFVILRKATLDDVLG